jgi:hypothetical protein
MGVGVGLDKMNSASGVWMNSVGIGVRMIRVAAGIGVAVGVPGRGVSVAVGLGGGSVEAEPRKRGCRLGSKKYAPTAMIPIPKAAKTTTPNALDRRLPFLLLNGEAAGMDGPTAGTASGFFSAST